jgi:hypothetical protein
MSELPGGALCFATCDHGLHLLSLIERLLPQIDPGTELLVIEDDAHQDRDAYAAIGALAERHPHLRYVRQPQRMGKAATIHACLEQAQAPVALVLDDGEVPDLTFLRFAREIAAKLPEVGLVRGTTQADWEPPPPSGEVDVIPMGREALRRYALSGAGCSGVAFHRRRLATQGLLKALGRQLWLYRDSLPDALDLLVAAGSHIVTTPAAACQRRLPPTEVQYPQRYVLSTGLGCQCDRLMAVHTAGASTDAAFCAEMLLRLCDRCLFTITAVHAERYRANSLDAGGTLATWTGFARAALIAVPEIASCQEVFLQAFDDLVSGYGQPAANAAASGASA